MTQPSVTELKVPNPSAPWSAVRIYRIPGHHQRSTGPVTEVCHDYHITWSSGGRPGENTTVGPPTLTARLRFSGNAQWGSERRELAALGLCMRILCFCINEKKKKLGLVEFWELRRGSTLFIGNEVLFWDRVLISFACLIGFLLFYLEYYILHFLYQAD